jgi:NAD(P)H-nitrite reductase large subunit
MNNNKHFIIIGNGPSGVSCAMELRAKLPEARITIISDEPCYHYDRTKLPEYAAGLITEEELYLQDSSFAKELSLELRLDQKVVKIDTKAKCITLFHREELTYDGLILATGARPLMPERFREARGHIYTLKTLRDAKRWRAHLKEVDSVLLIGGDLVSIRFAKILAKAKKRVALSLWGNSFWPYDLTQKLRDELTKSLTTQGIEVLPGESFSWCLPSGDKVSGGYTCSFGNKNKIYGLVGGFFGYQPDLTAFGQSALKLDRGIVSDEFLWTGEEDVFAAGDAAEVYSPELKNYWVSIGWANAKTLGKLAATNLLAAQKESTCTACGYREAPGLLMNSSWWL